MGEEQRPLADGEFKKNNTQAGLGNSCRQALQVTDYLWMKNERAVTGLHKLRTAKPEPVGCQVISRV
jgi:hypothetical protein